MFKNKIILCTLLGLCLLIGACGKNNISSAGTVKNEDEIAEINTVAEPINTDTSISEEKIEIYEDRTNDVQNILEDVALHMDEKASFTGLYTFIKVAENTSLNAIRIQSEECNYSVIFFDLKEGMQIPENVTEGTTLVVSGIVGLIEEENASYIGLTNAVVLTK